MEGPTLLESKAAHAIAGFCGWGSAILATYQVPQANRFHCQKFRILDCKFPGFECLKVNGAC